MHKKFLILVFGILLISGIFLFSIGNVSATYCCEKTLKGAWCQNAEKYECDEDGFKAQPTSCDATSYCQLGTCINTKEGTCSGNTAQKTCEQNQGYWVNDKPENIEQCQKGCCLMGDQAAFVTQTRCTMFASLYSTQVDFRSNIINEMSCLASVTSDVMGACVFSKENLSKTCTLIKQSECVSAGGEFHQGYLCSAQSLGTICGPSEKTTCVDGKDQVYFLDTCGNLANVYDYARRNDPTYWTSIIPVESGCGYGSENGNADSSTCGNCDYFLGSTCKAAKRGQDATPSLGNNICRNLDCKYNGKTYQHGETWCATDSAKNNLPGSQDYVLKCYNNEVTVEPCAVRRAEVCVQDDVNGFTSAECRANMWQDCVAQDNEKDCTNTEKRDCSWVPKYSWGKYNSNGDGACVPKFAPGFDFWNEAGQAKEICAAGTVTCEVKYEKGLIGGWDVKSNPECVPGSSGYQAWLNKMEGVCSSLGDCGSSVNYIGQKGFNELNSTKLGK